MACHHHSRSHQPHTETSVIKLFVLFTVFMLSAMLPIQFAVQKTIISPPNYVDRGGNAAFAYRLSAFFAFQVKLTWKFISTTAAQYYWLAVIPSAFLAISTAEIAAATATATTTADTSSTTTKLNTYLRWRFIIISVWWIIQFVHYLDQSIRNVHEIIISCYPKAMFGHRNNDTQFNWTIVGILLLKIILIKIYWRIVIAFVGSRKNYRLKRTK